MKTMSCPKCGRTVRVVNARREHKMKNGKLTTRRIKKEFVLEKHSSITGNKIECDNSFRKSK
jgi:uncharacterized Zn finger protein (UPF0148 family)